MKNLKKLNAFSIEKKMMKQVAGGKLSPITSTTNETTTLCQGGGWQLDGDDSDWTG